MESHPAQGKELQTGMRTNILSNHRLSLDLSEHQFLSCKMTSWKMSNIKVSLHDNSLQFSDFNHG